MKDEPMEYQTFEERRETLNMAAEAAQLVKDMDRRIEEIEAEVMELQVEKRGLERDLPDLRKLADRMAEIERDPSAARKYELIDAARHPNQQRLDFTSATHE